MRLGYSVHVSDVPVARVLEDGSVERLGLWHDDQRTLELVRSGFPFLGEGAHRIESRLPWVFTDMAPSGFLGARFSRAFPELRLPERSRDWSDGHVLTAITRRGEDLSGNLLIGEESIQRFETQFVAAIRSGALKRGDLEQLIDELLSAQSSHSASSLGGERPKLVLPSVGEQAPCDRLLKFSPPLDTPLGMRWSDLLLFESLCAQTLVAAGIPSVGGSTESWRLLPGGRRAGLLLTRFDRVGLTGRRGAATLYWLAASRDEFELDAPALMASLHRDGLVSAEDAATVARVHAFSSAIGNTDAHLGNYGLCFDAEGNARLAPIYDVTAMVLAPQADELPDERLLPRRTPVASAVQPLVAELVRRVRSEERLSQPFVERWLRYVGA